MEETDFSMNFIVAVLLAAVALLGIAIWSIKRHKDPHLELDTEAGLDELISSLSGMTLGMPIGGNAVEVFGGSRSASSGSARVESKAPGGSYRVLGSVPVNEAGYFRRVFRVKGGFRHKFRVTLGGETRTKKPVSR